ncbi:uncharacterized protein LOC128196685 [Vigna angularis]|uniref:uncharacterized protein LOC128196685 n=1 Tax=Phaseolus angularis TaxID=3914 RepID=UPI0022B2B38C|nr:uncharacterized protein LOC128196685 [Vigna angularis]
MSFETEGREPKNAKNPKTQRTQKRRERKNTENAKTQRTQKHRERKNTENAKTQRTQKHRERKNTENAKTQRTQKHRERKNTENAKTQRTQKRREPNETLAAPPPPHHQLALVGPSSGLWFSITSPFGSSPTKARSTASRQPPPTKLESRLPQCRQAPNRNPKSKPRTGTVTPRTTSHLHEHGSSRRGDQVAAAAPTYDKSRLNLKRNKGRRDLAATLL